MMLWQKHRLPDWFALAFVAAQFKAVKRGLVYG